jgi:hypothetical protein
MSNDDFIKTYQSYIGVKLPFTLDDITTQFQITQSSIDMLQYFEPVSYEEDVWMQIGNIAWGQGYHTSLYGNLHKKLIAVHGLLHENSKVLMEYMLPS